MGKKSSIDFLGDDIDTIRETFYELANQWVLPPIVIHKQEERWLKIDIDERDFYERYEPIWSPRVHHLEPIEYMYVSLGLRLPLSIKACILRMYSLLRVNLEE
jgi:hypothetical protein